MSDTSNPSLYTSKSSPLKLHIRWSLKEVIFIPSRRCTQQKKKFNEYFPVAANNKHVNEIMIVISEHQRFKQYNLKNSIDAASQQKYFAASQFPYQILYSIRVSSYVSLTIIVRLCHIHIHSPIRLNNLFYFAKS